MLWEEDLDRMLEELDKYEAQEEKDRVALGGVKNEGKKKGGKRGAAAAGGVKKPKRDGDQPPVKKGRTVKPKI